MQLSKNSLTLINHDTKVDLPDQGVFDLPEKILQFGTGVFLRGLIDYFINKANNEKIFNGRVIMVKSTDSGTISDFVKQDCLYTLLMKSVENNIEIDDKVVCASISRVLDARTDWNQVLACAANPELKIIISNTTEVGIVLVQDEDLNRTPPLSFPGKLLAFLLQRYKVFKGSPESGFVIIPTELIPENATKLKAIINQLAKINQLDPGFIDWLNTANDFCNSLVDRIVPGKLSAEDQKLLESNLGYEDRLTVMAESFGLWAIETSSSRTKELLSFHKAHEGIHIVENIEKFRELKLRLLNGSHNLSSALGFIAGFSTVKEAMANDDFDLYMRRLILDEIAKAILSENISPEDARQFGTRVLERYRNPYINFEWLSICVQDTSKIKIRAIPIIIRHYAKYGFVPDCICLGMAAYILFMRSELNEKGQYEGNVNGKQYVISDDFASNLYAKWKTYFGADLVKSVLRDEDLWEANLALPGNFAERVWFYLQSLSQVGFFETCRLTSDKLLPKQEH
jgi:tagaturonate reductase